MEHQPELEEQKVSPPRGERLSIDSWNQVSQVVSPDGAPSQIFENRATKEIVQEIPPNCVVYSDASDAPLYTFGNVFDSRICDGLLWERHIDPHSLRPFYHSKSLNISSWVLPPCEWQNRNTLKKVAARRRGNQQPGLGDDEDDSTEQRETLEDTMAVDRYAIVAELSEAHRVAKDKEILKKIRTENEKEWKVCVSDNDFWMPSVPMTYSLLETIHTQKVPFPESGVFYRNNEGEIQAKNPYEFEDTIAKVSSTSSSSDEQLNADIVFLSGDKQDADTVELWECRARLNVWISTLHLESDGKYLEANLKFPENIRPVSFPNCAAMGVREDRYPRLPFNFPDTVHAVINYMKNGFSQNFTVKIFESDTLGNVMERVFAQLDIQQSQRPKYLLKVCGVKDYMIHEEFPYLWFTYAQEQMRESEGVAMFTKPTYTLERLSGKDSVAVSSIRKRPYRCSSEGTKEERENFVDTLTLLWDNIKGDSMYIDDSDRLNELRAQLLLLFGIQCFERYSDLVENVDRVGNGTYKQPAARRKCAATCVDWDVFLDDRFQALRKSILSGNATPSISLHWPVRFNVKSIHGLMSPRVIIGKESFFCDSIRLDFGVYDCGKTIAVCSSTKRAFSRCIYWSANDSKIQFRKLLVSNLSPSTRIGVSLVGISSDGKEECFGIGAVRLFDEIGNLWQGQTVVHVSKWGGSHTGKVADWVMLVPTSVNPRTRYNMNSICKVTLDFERFLEGRKQVVYPPSNIHRIMLSPFQSFATNVNDSALRLVKENLKGFGVATRINNSATPGTTEFEKDKKVKDYVASVDPEFRNTVLSVMQSEMKISFENQDFLDSPLASKESVEDSEFHLHSKLMWDNRYRCIQNYRLLPKFLAIVKWKEFDQAQEARAMLGYWAEPDAETALSLLGIKYLDETVRAYAVSKVAMLNDEDLSDYLLQLVQCLKLERNHDSVLLRFLLRRALRNPHVVGHYLYWLLRAELHDEKCHSRFHLALETYLTHCGCHRRLLRKQAVVCNNLELITKTVMRIPKKEGARRREVLKQEIEEISWPEEFEISLWPGYNCRGVDASKCKVMDSKQAPLWIEFKNADRTGGNIKIIFKVGDDLRQDQITLLFLKIVNKMALKDGFDLSMIPYRVVGTGDMVGMVEIVPRSDTVARMQWAGGGPTNKNPLYDFILANARLMRENISVVPPERDEVVVNQFVRNFLRSCAGYVVATYVMGIGDRHPSNIMMQTDGHLFHIDFGHFLGNFKTKKIAPGLKFKRERSPLVFTPQMLHVLNPLHDEWDESHPEVALFLKYASDTFEKLRDESSLFTSLFTLMIPAGLPELKSNKDVDYMRHMLQLKENDSKEAKRELVKQIKGSLNQYWKQVDDLMHMFAHRHGSQDGNSTLLTFYHEQKLQNNKPPLYYYMDTSGGAVPGMIKSKSSRSNSASSKPPANRRKTSVAFSSSANPLFSKRNLDVGE